MEKCLFKKYQIKISNACLISSFSNLFMNSGTSMSESDIFFLGDGMTFEYCWTQDMGSMKDILIFHDSNIMMKNFFHYFDEFISMEKIDVGGSLDKFAQFLKMKIDNTEPVILSINTKYITYYKVQVQRYRPHFLTVIGYTDDTAIVVDCLVPTVKEYETYIGEFAFEDLYKASLMMQHIYYDFNYSHIIDKIEDVPENLIHKKFIENIKRHLDFNMPKLRLFAQNVKEIKKEFSSAEIRGSAEDLFFNIKYNGILHSRVLICNHLLQYERASEFFDLTEKLVKRWEAVNYTLLKYNLTNARQSKYDDLSMNILKLLDYETEVYKGILQTYYL